MVTSFVAMSEYLGMVLARLIYPNMVYVEDPKILWIIGQQVTVAQQ
jgi:hypothetical protein